LHVEEDILPVLLLFLLNMIQQLADLGVGTLKDCRVAGAGNILFRGQQVGAEEGIVGIARTLLLLLERLPAQLLALLLVLLPAALGHAGYLPGQELVDGIQVLLLVLGMGGKELLQLGALGLGRIALVFLDTDFFMLFLILQKHSFLLCEI